MIALLQKNPFSNKLYFNSTGQVYNRIIENKRKPFRPLKLSNLFNMALCTGRKFNLHYDIFRILK